MGKTEISIHFRYWSSLLRNLFIHSQIHDTIKFGYVYFGSCIVDSHKKRLTDYKNMYIFVHIFWIYFMREAILFL